MGACARSISRRRSRSPACRAAPRERHRPGAPPIIPMRLQPLPDLKPYEQPVIAADKVRYVGEPVAVVLADSPAIGEDALEAITVDIETLPAVTTRDAATKGDSRLFGPNSGNVALTFTAVCGA